MSDQSPSGPPARREPADQPQRTTVSDPSGARPGAPADGASSPSVTVFIAPNRVPKPAPVPASPPVTPPAAPSSPPTTTQNAAPTQAAPAAPPAPAANHEQAASFASSLTAKPAPPPTNQQKCSTCGHLNRAGLLICENCGTSLISATATILGTQKLAKDQVAAAAADANPKLNTAEVNALLSAGADSFDEAMLLRLEVEGSPTPLLVYPKAETSLGRRDPAGGTMPDVDLTSYAAYRLGVSRRHALLHLKEQQLQLVDLGSSNGTMVNGVRLVPHQPRTLRDGDEVMLGKMILRVIFQKNARR